METIQMVFFTDFTVNTLVGVPIDRFNEVLKILAPSPAPALSRVNFDNSAGSTVKLLGSK